MTIHRRRHGVCTALGGLLFSALTACGGGGAALTPASTPAPAPAPVEAPATARLVAPTSGKLSWNADTPIQVELKNGAGVSLTGLSCATDDAVALKVPSDCSNLKGLRLGSRVFTVSAGGVSAKVTVNVIAPAQPLAVTGSSSTGGVTSAVVTPEGKLASWGTNASQLLAQNLSAAALEFSATPVLAKRADGTDLSVAAASVGDLRAFALTEAGEVLSWGNNSTSLGRDATDAQGLVPDYVVSASGSGRLTGIVAVSAGNANAVALADDGRVYAWGYYNGFMDGPAKYPNLVLVPDGSGPVRNAVAVAAGWNWAAALLDDGTVLTWGFSSGYRTGQADTAPSVRAKLLTDRLTGAPLRNVVAVAAGKGSGYALTQDGKVMAWGVDSYGQLGQGAPRSTPQAGAVAVKGLDGIKVVMVAAGGVHALALTDQGKVLSWGYAVNGVLGDGANNPRVNESALPQVVASSTAGLPLDQVVAIAAGNGVSQALTADGRVFSWGEGFRGAQGQGAAGGVKDSFVPLSVKAVGGTGDINLGPIARWPNLLGRGR
jgi:alpha-tubulin suppressor-like RCC1 family protein